MERRPIFLRNRCTSVRQDSDETIISRCELRDTLTSGAVEISVKLPDMEITAVSAEFDRNYRDECADPAESLQKVIGVRIGSGMLKIIKGLVGGESNCGQAAFMVEECCHGVILAFTKDTLLQAPPEQAGNVDFYREMVRANIRLYNRCAAFAPGSSMVEGIEPPK